jgi:outer membrane immunogenic protein
MKKGLTIGLLTLGFCSASFANGYVPPEPVNYFDGFYVGIGAGLSHTYADATANTNDKLNFFDQIETSYPINLSADLGEIMGAGEAFVGWGNTFGDSHNGYFGIEVFGKYTPTSMSASELSQEIRLRRNESLSSYVEGKLTNDFSFGGDLRLGYLITPKVMIYALAGLDIGEFSYEVSHVATQYSMPDNLSYSDKVHSWQYGFMPGVGIEAMLTDNVSVRAQYTYTYFGDGDDVSAAKEVTMGERTVLTSAIDGVADSVQRGVFTLDLTYHFKGV